MSVSSRAYLQPLLLLLLLDLVWIIGSLMGILWWNFGRGPSGDEWWNLSVFGPPVMMLCFVAAGAYQVPLTAKLFEWWRTSFNGFLLFALTLISSIYLLKLDDFFPRLALVFWVLCGVIGLLALRSLYFLLLRRLNRGNRLATPVVLVGRLHLCLAMNAHFETLPGTNMRVVGIASDDTGFLPPGLASSIIEEVAVLAQEVGSTRVVICARPDESAVIDRVMALLISYPFEIDLAPDMSNLQLFCLQVENHGGVPFINLTGSPLSANDLMIKRIEDVVLSCVILILISWLLVIIAVLVKCLDPGPVFFVQNRHGLMGRTIRVIKFRTMTWNKQAAARQHAADAVNDPVMQPNTGLFLATVHGDARVTAFGKFLRNTSLDELPQFFNVLAGSMSIVGPRPHARRHNLKYIPEIPWLMRRHYVKPGITGLAQISGARGETRTSDDMQRRVTFDLHYIRSWSLWLDLQIIAQTVLKGFWNRQP